MNESTIYIPNVNTQLLHSELLQIEHVCLFLCVVQSSRLACDSSVSATDAEQLRLLCAKDPLYELSEQEKDFLWRHR